LELALEASALHAPATIGRISISGPLLRLRSDEQLVALFRAGNEDAFRTIHDRYRQRLFAYVRQMLSGSRQDAEDALQDVFLRAYRALRASDRPITLRAWLYRVAHNRCIDQLRRPVPLSTDLFDVSRTPLRDPLLEAERRDDLRRLVSDVRRLPEQQRSALLMRELQGLTYTELADALGTTVPAVKSLLVRARIGLVEAAESRDAPCLDIRRDLVLAFDRGVRMSGHVRRHVRDCEQCRSFRLELRGTRRSFAAIGPAGAGPFGLLAKLGLGGSGAAAGGGAISGGSGAAVAGGGAIAASATKLTIVCCAALVTVGGAVQLSAPVTHGPAPSPAHHRAVRHTSQAAESTAEPVIAPAPLSTRVTASNAPAVEWRHPSAPRHHHRSPVIDPDAALLASPPPGAPAGAGDTSNGPQTAGDTSATPTGSVLTSGPATSETAASGVPASTGPSGQPGDSSGAAGSGTAGTQSSQAGSSGSNSSSPPSGPRAGESGAYDRGAAASPGAGPVSGGSGG
jgi:RNA polymerase sigma factor (sigma-70 family)